MPQRPFELVSADQVMSVLANIREPNYWHTLESTNIKFFDGEEQALGSSWPRAVVRVAIPVMTRGEVQTNWRYTFDVIVEIRDDKRPDGCTVAEAHAFWVQDIVRAISVEEDRRLLIGDYPCIRDIRYDANFERDDQIMDGLDVSFTFEHGISERNVDSPATPGEGATT